MGSPTQRTLALLRKQGYLPAIVEKYVSFCRQRFDLYGCIDILAIKKGERDLGIQATSDSNVSARVHKLTETPGALAWLETGHRLLIHGWGKKGPRGKAKHWTLIEKELVIGQDGSIQIAEQIGEQHGG